MFSPRVSVRILHYAVDDRRKEHIDRLLDGFGGIEQAKKDSFSFEVFEDKIGHKDCMWKIAKQVWADFPEDATHHMVLQDDTIPSPDILKALPRLVSAVPSNPIGLFRIGSAPEEVVEREEWWWCSKGLIYGPAVILPTRMITHMLAWMEQNMVPDYKHDDRRIVFYMLEHGLLAWHPTPSLFDHAGSADSVLGNAPGGKTRVAGWFWNKSSLEIPFEEVPHEPFIESALGGTPADRKIAFPEGSPYALTTAERMEKYGRKKLRREDFEGTPWRL